MPLLFSLDIAAWFAVPRATDSCVNYVIWTLLAIFLFGFDLFNAKPEPLWFV